METTACHFHCSRELGALLPLKPAPENLTQGQQRLLEDYHSLAGQEAGEEWRKAVRESLGLDDIFWLDVEEAAGDWNIYASHRNWIEVARQRLTQMQDHPGLLQLVAQWGRVDVLKDVLKDPALLAQRQPMQVQMAFQGALEHALEPKFDVRLIELLMEHGAKAAGCCTSMEPAAGASARDHSIETSSSESPFACPPGEAMGSQNRAPTANRNAVTWITRGACTKIRRILAHTNDNKPDVGTHCTAFPLSAHQHRIHLSRSWRRVADSTFAQP